MNKNTMQFGVHIKSDGTSEIIKFNATANNMNLLRSLVNGYYEEIPLPKNGISMWVNEEGNLLNLNYNRVATSLVLSEMVMRGDKYSPRKKLVQIVGDVFITNNKSDADGNLFGIEEGLALEIVHNTQELNNAMIEGEKENE